MLFGQRIQQNEREKRLRKSQLYREMLDNQIRLNSEYRHSHADSHALKQTQTHKFYQPMPMIQKKASEPLQNSFVYKLQRQQASRFLPVLKDSNKFMKGVSRFVKVEEPPKQRHRVEHFPTEMIEEQDNDEYDETCEKIIRDLQDIKNKPIKSRNRRKLYSGSEMHSRGSEMHSRGYRLHTDPQQLDGQPYDRQLGNKSLAANYQSLKPENRYAKFQPLQPKIQRQQINEFTSVSLGEETKARKHLPGLNRSNLPQPQGQNSAHSPQSYDSINRTSTKDQNGRTKLSGGGNSKLSAYNTPTNQDSAEREKKNLDSQTKQGRSQLQNRDRKGNNSVSYTQSEHEKKDESSKVSMSAASTAKLQLQRQTFLQLLRKVKNRGESLYLKLAKFPNEKSAVQQ